MSFTSSPAFVPRWSDVYISAVARAVSTCGDMLAATALVLVLAGRGEGGVAVAAILLAASIPMVILGPVVGRAADRFDSRTIIVLTGLAQAAICAVLAYERNTMVIIALVALLASGLALTSPTMSALTPEMVGRDNLAKAGGIGQTAASIGMLLAPALGGVLVGEYGVHVPLLVDAASYLILPIAGFAIRTRRGGTALVPVDPAPDAPAPVTGWTLRSDRLVWPLLVLLTAVLLALSAINVIDVFYVRHTLHSSATTYGLMGTVWVIGMLIGAVLWGSRKLSDAAMGRWMFVLLGASSVLLALAAGVPHASWLVPLWLLGGAVNGCENITAGVLLSRRVPAAFRGRAMATFNSMANSATSVGMVAGGVLVTFASPRLLVLACGLVGCAALAAFLAPVLRAVHAESVAATAGSESSPDRIDAVATPA